VFARGGMIFCGLALVGFAVTFVLPPLMMLRQKIVCFFYNFRKISHVMHFDNGHPCDLHDAVLVGFHFQCAVFAARD
jgi:hypothetical protein